MKVSHLVHLRVSDFKDDTGQIMKRTSPKLIMYFKMDFLAFPKYWNQKNWSKKYQDTIYFPRLTKTTMFMETLQPTQFGPI